METRPSVKDSASVAHIARSYLRDVDREHFIVIMLDRKNKVIGINTVSVGSLSASVVHPREVFKAAIVMNANALVCAHNHPSGNTEPSKEDVKLTKILVDGGKLLGIEILDHVIIGDGTEQHYSFADNQAL